MTPWLLILVLHGSIVAMKFSNEGQCNHALNVSRTEFKQQLQASKCVEDPQLQPNLVE